jgi:hypothetical protein
MIDMRRTLSALVAAVAVVAVAAPAAEAHQSSRKHRHTSEGTIYSTPGPYGSPGYGRSYRDVPYDARAHSVDPAKDYKDYPNWARWALSPKSDGARN